MKKSISVMLRKLLRLIENDLQWGSSDSWSQKDFQILSEKIFEKTGKQLSITTLKRVWGRTTSSASPSMASLDILAEFMGYAGWRDFGNKSQLQSSGSKSFPRLRPYWKWGMGFAGLCLFVLIFWSLSSSFSDNESKSKTTKKAYEANDISKEVFFDLEKVATGYPNTVVFRYDYGDLDYDEIQIQQSWDTRKQIPLQEANGLVTSTYYQPGYFLAKLIADNEILIEKNLYIPTQGWQGMVLSNEGPSYLGKNELNVSKTVSSTSNILPKLVENKGKLYLAHLSPEPVIDGQNFQMETSFRMSEVKSNSICHNIGMIITGTREVISLEFSKPGCVGDLTFFLDKEMVSGRNYDLSAFGRETFEWTTSKVQVEDGILTVFIEEEEVFSRKLKVDLGKIGGVQWYFDGLGEIKGLELSDAQQSLDLIPSVD